MKKYKKPQSVDAAQLLIEYRDALQAQVNNLRKQAYALKSKVKEIDALITEELAAQVEEREEMEEIWTVREGKAVLGIDPAFGQSDSFAVIEYKHEADVE